MTGVHGGVKHYFLSQDNTDINNGRETREGALKLMIHRGNYYLAIGTQILYLYKAESHVRWGWVF